MINIEILEGSKPFVHGHFSREENTEITVARVSIVDRNCFTITFKVQTIGSMVTFVSLSQLKDLQSKLNLFMEQFPNV